MIFSSEYSSQEGRIQVFIVVVGSDSDTLFLGRSDPDTVNLNPDAVDLSPDPVPVNLSPDLDPVNQVWIRNPGIKKEFRGNKAS